MFTLPASLIWITACIGAGVGVDFQRWTRAANSLQVIVITHHHADRKGIRYLAPGLKVYHLPIIPIASQATLPNYLLSLPWFRHIMIREHIDLVHGHGTLSSLAHEAMWHSHLLGIRSVMSDHSLFGFGDAVGVLTNKLLAGALRNVDGVICVSNTGSVSVLPPFEYLFSDL